MSRYAVDPGDRSNTVRAAIDAFTNAVNVDPDNADAKFNLEIVLRDFFHQVAPASAPRPRPAGRPRRRRRPRRLWLLMELTFLTPLAAIFAVSALLPLGIYWFRERRASRIRGALGLEGPSLRSRVPLVVAVAAVPVLLGIAAAQPVLGTERSVPERTDAEAFFVMDTSRSMLAADGPEGPTRFDRAVEAAAAPSRPTSQVRLGIVSMTDRILPHALPTTDRRVFEATLRRSIGVELPPPAFTYSTYATSYDILAGIPQRRYFSQTAKKRLLGGAHRRRVAAVRLRARICLSGQAPDRHGAGPLRKHGRAHLLDR